MSIKPKVSETNLKILFRGLLCLVGLVTFMTSISVRAVMHDEPRYITPYGHEGCWVMVFAGKGFQPPMARLKGPAFIEAFENGPVKEPELEKVGGQEFFNHVQSIIVGPHARLIGYQKTNFQDEEMTLKAGEKIADLDHLGFHGNVKSIKTECQL